MKKFREGDKIWLWDEGEMGFLTGTIDRVSDFFYDVNVKGCATKFVAIDDGLVWATNSKSAQVFRMQRLAEMVEELTVEIDEREEKICRLLDLMLQLHGKAKPKR